MQSQYLPKSEGLYNPEFEHDACGTGFMAHIDGARSHAIVRDSLEILVRLAHRGGTGVDPDTGDGAGILVQIPDRFFRKKTDFQLPSEGQYAVGMFFLPLDQAECLAAEAAVEVIAKEEKLTEIREKNTEQFEIAWERVQILKDAKEILNGELKFMQFEFGFT
mgnify:CR=1 FL=1